MPGQAPRITSDQSLPLTGPEKTHNLQSHRKFICTQTAVNGLIIPALCMMVSFAQHLFNVDAYR